uniref:Uncharacterized protein n=1 Tax=Hippocampus comes TaxID=109280 RepID=A0A3Q3E7Q9_HIPCM
MNNRHLSVKEDDLYSGYNDYNPLFDCKELENDTSFQEAIKSNQGRRAHLQPVCIIIMILILKLRTQSGAARPISAISAAGYSSSPTRCPTFDPLGQSRGPAPPLEEKKDDTPEEKIKLLEKSVNDLIAESCVAQSTGNSQLVRLRSTCYYSNCTLSTDAFCSTWRTTATKQSSRIRCSPTQVSRNLLSIKPELLDTFLWVSQ